jgi:hypothetical protein
MKVSGYIIWKNAWKPNSESALLISTEDQVMSGKYNKTMGQF